MTVTEQVTNEIALLKKKCTPRQSLCCDAAMTVYNALGKGHSGHSWYVAVSIFERFARHKNRLDIAEHCWLKAHSRTYENPAEYNDSLYGDMCLKSAVDAYCAFCTVRLDDGSELTDGDWVFTRDILHKMMNELPLTPVEEDEDCWQQVGKGPDGSKRYQCSRIFSFFKDVYPDGRVDYRDDWVVAAEVRDDGSTSYWNSGVCTKLAEEMFGPFVKFPYNGCTTRYEVYRKCFNSVDGDPGSYDMVWIQYIRTPEDKKVPINRYLIEQKGGNDRSVTADEFLATLREREPRVHEARIERAKRRIAKAKDNNDQEHIDYWQRELDTETQKPFTFDITELPKENSDWLPAAK